MKLQPRQQTITIQILPNISKSKSKRTMKFDQLVEYNREIFFFKNHAGNQAGRLLSNSIRAI